MNALIPTVHAVMARRILVNFRVRPEVVAQLLPHPFRPKLVDGWAMAGICLIRLEDMRPAWLPRVCGMTSENAAHRIAMEWTENGHPREGVFIPRRDTNSLLNRVAGGRLFPGVHHSASFRCVQNGAQVEVALQSRDTKTRVEVVARLTDNWPRDSVFKSLEEASTFLRTGGCGWSPAPDGTLEGVELCPESWAMHPLAVERVESSFLSDPRRFPPGTVEFDCALLMRNIAHAWRALGKFAAQPRRLESNHHRPIPFLEMP